MLELTIVGDEYWDEATETFVTFGDVHVVLEHSLVSVSKWESITLKPFLVAKEKTPQEVMSYFRCMLLTPLEDESVFFRMSQKNIDEISAYIESPASATTFGQMPKSGGHGETITSELIYYWMVAFNVPFECQYWHLNRLFALIRICNLKNSPPQKMSPAERAQHVHKLNAERKAKLNSAG